ncbi:LAMI_0H03246g1_1 [Lachancea mirantina]|uniref:LAMI_0H03246g1_1 n=1 Tax=Lachancea mirantina TaxID=1230905 RepID=A0A1G4KEC8_9SACH|nr:LAMI_0H03246g1_1 [Lachancea mirantina]
MDVDRINNGSDDGGENGEVAVAEPNLEETNYSRDFLAQKEKNDGILESGKLEGEEKEEQPELPLQLPQQLQLQSSAISALGNKVKELESVLGSKDSGLDKTLEDMAGAVKNLVHNQQVLESKFEDLQKNQVNSDTVVNSLLEKIEQVSQFLNRAAKNNALVNVGPVQPVHRGPGRPPKNRNTLTNAIASLSVVPKELLPNGAVGVARSKRYFNDPEADDTATEEEEIAAVKIAKKASTPVDINGVPVKKRGPGRPPKKKHHWARKADAASAASAPLSPPIQQTSQELGLISTKSEGEESNDTRASSMKPAGADSSFLEGATAGNELLSTPGVAARDVDTKVSPSQATSKRIQELERQRDEREQMLVSMKYSDREKAKWFMESNKEILLAMREEERKKRMTALGNDLQSNGPTPASTSANTPSPGTIATSSRGALMSQASEEVHDLPLSSKTDLELKESLALRSRDDEEGRESLSMMEDKSLAEVTSPPTDAQNELMMRPGSGMMMVSSFDNMNTLGVVQPRKIGIMSMLNNDDEDYLLNKKDLPDLWKFTTSADLYPPKKEKIDEDYRREFRSMLPMLPEKKDNRGRPANSSSSGDNSTALLLASPVELLCRDGLFYKRSDPKVPISTGAYLEFKFKSKEDELIRLTMNEEDYAELTRQDRMNAYFLKPDVEVETEFASKVLSKIILTEKYVNSLEYFLMEFRWENKLVGLGLKLRESKRTWQRRKALFALFEFWRDKSRENRGFPNFTILHAVKEMENYRIFINRSVSWFYNHITLLKMILFDLCENTDTQWRMWMFPKGKSLPTLGDSVTEENINEIIDKVLTFEYVEERVEDHELKPSSPVENLNM